MCLQGPARFKDRDGSFCGEEAGGNARGIIGWQLLCDDGRAVRLLVLSSHKQLGHAKAFLQRLQTSRSSMSPPKWLEQLIQCSFCNPNSIWEVIGAEVVHQRHWLIVGGSGFHYSRDAREQTRHHFYFARLPPPCPPEHGVDCDPRCPARGCGRICKLWVLSARWMEACGGFWSFSIYFAVPQVRSGIVLGGPTWHSAEELNHQQAGDEKPDRQVSTVRTNNWRW